MTDTPAPAMAQGAETASAPSVAEPSRASVAKKLVFALLLPLYFVIVFPVMFVSALHAPTPHDLSLIVVGPAQVVGQIADGLDETREFRATHTDVVEEARSSVEDRTVEGAIEITPVPAADPTEQTDFVVTTYYADAEGRSVGSAVRAAGDQVAEQLGTTAEAVDVAPLAATDTLGTTLFYLLTYTSLAAYLVIIVLTQVQPRARLRTRYLASAITAVIAPLIVFGLSSIWVGDYGASFGTIAGLLGVNALYVFTVGAAAILIQQFLGNVATFGIMGFIVFLNFPSAGGAGPSAMLPPFWQAVHSFYFGAGANEAFRSIVYFDGAGAQRWVLQLLAWTVGLVLATVVVHLVKTVRAQRVDLALLTDRDAQHVDARRELREANRLVDDEAGDRHRHVKVEAYVLDDEPDAEAPTSEPRRSITAGHPSTSEGTAR
ncbi:ABC transporter permease [Frigoribacterium sp. PhB24]|uniref:ABC transporter permease n=1 Tax=Frigoribacterium sp. PhB24 TaxID=2485204 RepID=UPI000F46DC28|nr:ABC transporter permease [Frigoribacterium sp. PhB24]ROS48880.1 hypothetical protein EDF50_2665 [Frigoribacterium sp. PhB24]